MILNNGEKFLVLRYGTNIIENCIEKHIDVLTRYGCCWFGKLGVVPSDKSLRVIDEQTTHRLVLYSRFKTYICDYDEVTKQKPSEGYPDYYNEYLFGNNKEPSIYFRLTSIEEIPLSILSETIVCSSRNVLQETLNKSMSSYFLAELPGNKEDLKSTTSNRISQNRKKKEVVSENDCRYRINGKCNLKSCVNYQYECERPNMCLKQKR